uniref:Putative secreted protein n=1 Tax=Anopheles triannulatus TaxID=58253 RepID=A0A2M4B2Q1_9DIPT
MVVCCVLRSRFLAHLLHLFSLSLHLKTSLLLTLAHGCAHCAAQTHAHSFFLARAFSLSFHSMRVPLSQ